MRDFLKPSNNGFVQIVKFAIAGAIATAVDFVIFGFFIKIFTFQYGYMLASTMGFVCASLVSYVISIKWIFPNRAIKDRRLEFVIFLILGAIGLLINLALFYIFIETEYLKVITVFLSEGIHRIYPLDLGDLWVSKIAITVIVFFWNFFARKIILFRKTER